MCTKKGGEYLGMEECYESWGNKVHTEWSDIHKKGQGMGML
jgi:hypothetical protein